jgi:hypothetical protein
MRVFLVLQRKNWEMGGVAEKMGDMDPMGTHRRYCIPGLSRQQSEDPNYRSMPQGGE